ncbi:hypothetical protein H7E67_02165 [Clostridium gasigenes]|uniref:hypothetical protein n=1 Tax=Clostridium gasigenes TaxID=94869 RepID=UPI001623A856|nr:hypothetical protein [Clostridium gasigenes]MBB6622226.1 hypothetical protein [Clostridium gasigenes]
MVNIQGYYLRVENENFGFVVDEVHDIKDTDNAITTEDYNKFFNLQGEGKQFRIKENSTGTGLFDYIEEYIQTVDTTIKPISTEDRMKAIEDLIMGGL